MTVVRGSRGVALSLLTCMMTAVLVVLAPHASAAALVVNSSDDLEGPCTSVHCSLRQAIESANSTPGVDTISFALPEGSTTIQPSGDLPHITEAVVIDGSTQPGYSGTPLVVLNGEADPDPLTGDWTTTGLTLYSSGSTVRGLVINGFRFAGVRVIGDQNLIESNYIGTHASGSQAIKNGYGVYIVRGSGNAVGGLSAGARNVVSGNGYGIFDGGSGTSIQGNLIGTDKDGLVPVPNEYEGVRVHGSDAVIGGLTQEARNVVSGNTGYGVYVWGGSARNVKVLGNFIGTDISGTKAIGNRTGILVGTTDNIVGGSSPGAGNLISGNRKAGIALIDGAAGNRVQGNRVGTDVTGAPLGNGTAGLVVDDGRGPNTIGGTGPAEGNTIAFNRWGVVVGQYWTKSEGASIVGNSIFENSELGIDLTTGRWPDGVTPNDAGDVDEGGNHLQNTPVLEGGGGRSPVVHGTLSSTPDTTFTIEFFTTTACDTSGSGEGEIPAGTLSVTTDSTGIAKFRTNLRSSTLLDHVTATATDPHGNTSEFSNCL